MRSSRRHDSFHDDSLFGRFVRQPLRRVGQWFVHLIPSKSDDIQKSKKVSIGRAVNTILEWVLVAPLQFLVSSWSTSREGLPFLLGLPAVLTALAAVIPSLAFSVTQDKIRRGYDALSSRAIAANEKRAAEIFSAKLFALVPDNRDYYFRMAMTIGNSRDDGDYSMELMKQVAVDASPQTINGHVQIAEYLASRSEQLSEEDIQTADHHLKMAFKADPEHYSAHTTAYKLFVKAGQHERAVEHARALTRAEPLLSPLLLMELKELGREDELQHALNDMVLQLSEVAYRVPNEIRLWEALVQCCMLGERYDEAFSHVETGLTLCTNQTTRLRLTLLASRVLVGWYDEIKTFTDKAQFQQSIRTLNAALILFMGNSDAIQRASDLYLDPNLDSKRMDWVMETLALDDNAFCTHMMIGWRALFIDKENGVETARTHWQIAKTSTDMFVTVLAQLTSTIAASEPDKVPLALQAIDLALSIEPANVDLAEARGLILMSGERWFEARQQMDEILTKTPRTHLILNNLIKCCEKLGDEIGLQEYKAKLELLENLDVSR